MINLGGIPVPFGGQSVARGVSADGEVVVGHSYYERTNRFEAFRWTEETGMVGLGDLPGGNFFSKALGVSGDGLIVTGHGVAEHAGRAFRWTAATGMVGLEGHPGWPEAHSDGTAVSSDGSSIVGYANYPGGNGASEAIRWRDGEGALPLGLAGAITSQATAVSGDGSVVVGRVIRSSGDPDYPISEAFRWTQETGMVPLGFMPQRPTYSRAIAVSGNGSVVVGHAAGSFIWDEKNGMRSLREVLEAEYGLDFGEWSLGRVTGISADGRTMVGWGTNPQGLDEGWIVRLEPACTADFDGDGSVGSGDFFAFLDAFFVGSEGADITGDDVVNSDDFFGFLGVFFEGCA